MTQRSWTIPARNKSAFVVEVLKVFRHSRPNTALKEAMERSTATRFA